MPTSYLVPNWMGDERFYMEKGVGIYEEASRGQAVRERSVVRWKGAIQEELCVELTYLYNEANDGPFSNSVNICRGCYWLRSIF